LWGETKVSPLCQRIPMMLRCISMSPQLASDMERNQRTDSKTGIAAVSRLV
jgi:hypothetical protein